MQERGIVQVATHAADDRVEARCLGGVVPFVGHIRFVNDPSEVRQSGVGQLVVAEQHLERARPVVVTELGSGDVERRGIVREVIEIGDEQKLRRRIDVHADEPGTRCAVHVNAGSRDPSHAVIDSIGRARLSTAERARSRPGASKWSRSPIRLS